jgi:hypothetical protein
MDDYFIEAALTPRMGKSNRMLQMSVRTGPILTRHNRQRRKLALALLEVEVAHARLGKLDPTDAQYGRRLQELASALGEYWRIDSQIEDYLQGRRING